MNEDDDGGSHGDPEAASNCDKLDRRDRYRITTYQIGLTLLRGRFNNEILWEVGS